MLERADARLWFAMMSTACAVPAVVLVISAAWFMYFDFAPPIILGVAPLGPSMLAKVEAAAPPPHRRWTCGASADRANTGALVDDTDAGRRASRLIRSSTGQFDR